MGPRPPRPTRGGRVVPRTPPAEDALARALVRRLAHVVLPFQARLSARRALAVASPAFPRPRPARARIDPTRVPAGRVFPEEDHHTGRGPVAAHRARITFSPGTSATLAPKSLRCGACWSVAQFFARAERKAIEPQPRKGAGHPHLAPVDFSASAVSDGHFQIRFLTETLCAVDAVWQKFPNR